MKKIGALAILPIIALASCGKEEVVTPEVTTPVENNTPEVQNVNVEEQSNTENLNQNISSVETDSETQDTERLFAFSYEEDGNIIPVSGKFLLENGKITGIVVDGVDVENDRTPLASFARNVPSQIVGKELKGLQVDTVSGASYVTVGFNNFLSSL
ncbi:MAG: hypothetical protein AB7E37_01005 [Candidatus Altimarinota bacterium]